MHILLPTAIILLTATGQLLLKKGALMGAHIIINRYVFLGYFVFILVMVMSIGLMYYAPLKYFSTIVSMNYPCTAILAAIVHKEKMNPKTMLACGIVIGGCIVFNLDSIITFM